MAKKVKKIVKKESKVNKFGRRFNCQSGFIDAHLDKTAVEIVRLWNRGHPKSKMKTGISRIRGHLRYMVEHKQITKEAAAKILKS